MLFLGVDMEEDIVVDYMVTKLSDVDIDMIKLMKALRDYMQNNEIYYSYTPHFVEGVMVFGIVGFRSEHDKLQSELYNTLGHLGFYLEVSLERE